MFVCIRCTQLKSLTSAPVWGVEAQQLDEEPVHVELALEGLEDDVEHAVGVEVEEADDGLDQLEHLRRRHCGQVLVQLGHQLCVALGLLAEQVVLLLLVEELRLEFDDGLEKLLVVLDDTSLAE